MKRFLLLAVMVVGLASCGVDPQDVGDDAFDPNLLAYFKDYRTNICYSVQAYSRMSTNGTYASGQSHTAVPCSPEVEKLLRNKQ